MVRGRAGRAVGIGIVSPVPLSFAPAPAQRLDHDPRWSKGSCGARYRVPSPRSPRVMESTDMKRAISIVFDTMSLSSIVIAIYFSVFEGENRRYISMIFGIILVLSNIAENRIGRNPSQNPESKKILGQSAAAFSNMVSYVGIAMSIFVAYLIVQADWNMPYRRVLLLSASTCVVASIFITRWMGRKV